MKNKTVEITKIIPISPIRLYIIACRAEALASCRVNHHPMSRNDKNPTPSHPMKNRKSLFEEVNKSIFKRNIINNRKNLTFNASLSM